MICIIRTQREADRRQNMIDQLITKHKQLELAVDNRDSSRNQRSTLMTSGSGFDGYDDEPLMGLGSGSQQGDDTDLIDIGQIRQQQRQMIAEQDQGLDALSRIIGRQRQIAVNIGNEVESQNELIDDITDHVDQTNVRLLRETQHISVVGKKSNTCWMWLVIVLLIVAIIVIVAVPYEK